MTTTTKAPRKLLMLSKPKAATVKPAPGTPTNAARSAPHETVVIGGEPRVHLLPLEVIARKNARGLRRRLGLALVALIVVVAVGVGLATLSMVSSNAALLAAQSETATLLQQQAQYGRVLKVKADVSAIVAAQKVATSQEIAWQPYIVDIQSTLPSGASVTSLAASIDAPFQTEVATTDPLEGPRIATVNVTLSMPQSSISGWLATLPQLKGFVDATPNSITAGTPGGPYTVTVTIHINKDALENRFTKAGNK